jgi:hypothetical protein
MSLTIIQVDSGHIYVDMDKNILHLEILNEKFNMEDFTNLLNIFKQFILAAMETQKKYYLVFHAQKIGIYPLSCYGTIKDLLEEIGPSIKKIIHATCVIVEPNVTSSILKFFFSIYNPVRPAKIAEQLEEAYEFFKDPNCVNHEPF